MPAAISVLAIIFGVCIIGTALLNMGVAGIVLAILVVVYSITEHVRMKRQDKFDKMSGRDEWRYKNGGID